MYKGETVDISSAVSWPDYSVAWCSAEGAYCMPPDQIISITGNMHRYYIDPDKFNYGTYYRWSGAWNRGENMNAFVVRYGNRTDTIDTITIDNVTVMKANVSRVVKPEKTSIVIARGDSGTFSFQNESVYGDGHMWLFGGNEYVNGGTHAELDIKMSRTNDSYYYDFTPAFTNNLDYGNYTGYLQANGRNGFQDVYYIKNYKTPFNATYPVLESIYKAIPMQSIHGAYPKMIESLFTHMVTDPTYSDDTIVPLTMQVFPPEIFVGDYYETDDTIYIEGTTTLNANCTISAVIDPDHYPLAKDLKANTHYANVTGDIHSMRKFAIDMEIPWGEMNIGMHEVKFTGLGYKNDLKAEQTLLFKVSDIYVMPTPTIARERVIVEDYGWHRVTPVPSITPNVTIATPVPTKVNLGNISYDGNKTSVIKPNITATTTPTPKPTTTLVIPLSPLMGMLALVIAMAVLRRK